MQERHKWGVGIYLHQKGGEPLLTSCNSSYEVMPVKRGML